MPRNSTVDRPATRPAARNGGLLRHLWRQFVSAKLDSRLPRGLSSHLLRDIGLAGQSTGDDGEGPWKRLK